ncbi:hypothetical protein ACH5RR_008807 [Cinchona calisaya]|uniref:Uncharacterized protein n=1 Tax=Cinchona calisaya TaxID=153742 RepID=A0ABD3AGC0_9GENT
MNFSRKSSEDEDDTMPELESPIDDEDDEQEDLFHIPTLVVLWAFHTHTKDDQNEEFKDVFPEEISLVYHLPGVLSTKLILSQVRSSLTNPPIKPIQRNEGNSKVS